MTHLYRLSNEAYKIISDDKKTNGKINREYILNINQEDAKKYFIKICICLLLTGLMFFWIPKLVFYIKIYL